MKVYVINLLSEGGDRETLVFKEKPTEEQIKALCGPEVDYDEENVELEEDSPCMHIESESWIEVQ